MEGLGSGGFGCLEVLRDGDVWMGNNGKTY